MAQNDQGRVPESLRKQLSIAVRSIQWSYAIFWSISGTQPGVLEWGDGYYNGDIKTRKTIQALEIKADELGLERSQQLKELYNSLAAGESSPQSKRPCVSLSPEDLSDTEWYYLVCMSFVFDIGEGLPGRTLATGQPVWLCNAPYADSKLFSRSLLAKSASIQTIVCFPFSDGVIELGTTEAVKEDLSLVQRVKGSFLEIDPIQGGKRSGEGLVFDTVFDNELIPVVGELDVASPNISSSGFGPDHLMSDAFLIGEINLAASQVQSWPFVDDEFSNGGGHCSMNSSDCISQTLVEPVKVSSIPKGEKANDQCNPEANGLSVHPPEPENDDLHYQSVLSSLLKSHHQLILGPHIRQGRQDSNFSGWKKDAKLNLQKTRDMTSQRVLKKILFEVPQKHKGLLKRQMDNTKENEVSRLESDNIGLIQMLSEGTQGQLISERFYALKSIIPSIGKVDQVTLLDDTIDYLNELKKRVEELESVRKESTDSLAKSRKKSQEVFERISNNCDHIKSGSHMRTSVGKRKNRDAEEVEEVEIEQRDGPVDDNLTIRLKGKEVEIDIMCDWREGVLLEIIEALSDLRLDTQSVQSSSVDGVLSLQIKSKYRGPTNVAMGMIRTTLERVIRRS